MTFRLFGNEVAIRDYFPLLRWMIFTGVTLSHVGVHLRSGWSKIGPGEVIRNLLMVQVVRVVGVG